MQPSFPGNSYEELLTQIRKHVRDQELSAEILRLLHNAPEAALKAQGIVLSRPERERLSQTIMKEVLSEVLEQVNKGENA
ncbi:MAG: hypothetical protein EHM33_06545 [Chloroflexi bacterium]|nr:MAG: hypothetical protein EHM33_06545 [Chloroflexota bacterium]